MREITSQICLLLLLVAGVGLMPQTSLFAAETPACGDQAFEAIADGCCASQSSDDDHQSLPIAADQHSSNPCAPCDSPCDNSCDCCCCLKTVRSAPMLAGTLTRIVAGDTLATAPLPNSLIAGQTALSVPIQPPIV